MSKRNIILKIHQVIGLITGIVLFIVALTGALWTFKNEIEHLYSPYKKVVIQKQDLITASKVKAIAEKKLPNKQIHGVIFGQPHEALEVIFYKHEPLFYQSLFLNPYSGKVLYLKDHTKGFFSFVLNGHTRLWLPEKIGGNIIGISVLLFFIIAISGIILWWPKTLKQLKLRLKFNWNNRTKWTRKNLDLHSIGGFYLSSFILTFAFTGCIMAFGWFYYIAYITTGGIKEPRFIIPNNLITKVSNNDVANYDVLLPKLYKHYKNKANSFEFHYPSSDSSSILIEVNRSKGVYYDRDYLFFDRYTNREINTSSIYGKYNKANFADKLIRMNYDIHVGAIGGITGKIIAFVASLLCAALPVTGVLIWYKRYKKRIK